jgi:hypothetical protein
MIVHEIDSLMALSLVPVSQSVGFFRLERPAGVLKV